MKLKYANQLTENELDELYSAFIKSYGGFQAEQPDVHKDNFNITFDGSYYVLNDDNVKTLFDGSFTINDYGVVHNDYDAFDDDFEYGYDVGVTKVLREFMLNKFGKQYMKDCFWNDFGGEDDD